MAIYFIDGDNNPKENIKGIELTAQSDEIHIFYASQNTYFCNEKNRKEVKARTNAKLYFYKIRSGKNAVDFAVSIEAADKMHNATGQNFFLVSSDKHFELITNILRSKAEKGTVIKRVNNLWEGVVANPEGIDSWDKVRLLMKTMLGNDGEALCARIKSLQPDEPKEQTLIQKFFRMMNIRKQGKKSVDCSGVGGRADIN